MLIPGRWGVSEDGIVRPVIIADVLAADGSWLSAEFLVDIGADRTVFMAPTLKSLALPHLPAPSQLGGVGGAASTVSVGTHIRFAVDGGGTITFQGTFAAFTNPDALDMNVLGRDIINLFAVIVDRPGNLVCMIGKGHRYAITKDS
jgi:hypothetical protein